MLWLALYLPDLPLQVHTRGTPEPGLLAVTEARPRQHVVAATDAAIRLGVAAGCGLASALAMAPALTLRPRDAALEAATLQEVAAWAGCYTPHVSLDPPDAILLEVSASLRLFGGLPALMQDLRDASISLGLKLSQAAAPTPLAARWLARTRPGSQQQARKGWQDCLADLPLGVLADAGVDEASLGLLVDVGARTLADVMRLPRAGLARRQAGAVTGALARARGEQADPRPWFVPPPVFEARVALPVPCTQIEPLLFASRRLFATLTGWLAARHAGIEHCTLVLDHEGVAPTRIEIITGAASRDEQRLNLLAREHLAARPLPAPVEMLSLQATAPSALAARSADLFGDPDSERENASLLVDRLGARLGREAVFSLRPHADHRPERAWRSVPPGSRPGKACALPDGLRPLWLLPAPQALPPGERLTLLAGPERIESGWWDGDDVRRDYYVARTNRATLCWVFRPLDGAQRWYVHGYFA